MENSRRTKEDMPVLAICYDFDKTLSPDDMQAQGYIQAVYDEKTFTCYIGCSVEHHHSLLSIQCTGIPRS